MIRYIVAALVTGGLLVVAEAEARKFPPKGKPGGSVSCAISAGQPGLSNNTFPAGSSPGTVVGAITVATTGTCGTDTLTITGADAASFSLSTTHPPANLLTVGTLSGGPYSINLVSTIGGATGSPATHAYTITATGGAGTPSAVALSTAFPVIYDNSAAATVVSAITVTMTSGSFSGTLGFATASSSDLVIDGTTTSIAKSASHFFASVVNFTDLVQVANDINHNSVSSAAHPFTIADAFDYTGRPTQLRITGGTGWNAGNGVCPTPTASNAFVPCAWTIACTGDNTGICPPLVVAPASGVAQLMQTQSSGNKPADAGATGGIGNIVLSDERNLVVTVTGGSGCTTGDYRIISTQADGSAIFDRAIGTAGSTCTFTMIYDGGGRYSISGSNLVVGSTGMLVGDATDNVKLTATQNAVTATSSLSPINRVGQLHLLFVNLSGPQPSSIYDSGLTNGYGVHYSTTRATPPTTPGGSHGATTPQWTTKGGDCADAANAHVGACPPASGIAYATATPAASGPFTLTATGLVADALAVSSVELVNAALTVGTSFRTITACSSTDASKRPKITYHYTTGSDVDEQCLGSNEMSVTETWPRQVTVPSPMSLVASSINVGASFPRPDPVRTLSTATLTFNSESGTPTISLWRLKMPYQATVDAGAAISDSYIQDGCGASGEANNTCAIAGDAHIIHYVGPQTTVTSDLLITSLPDYTANSAYNYAVPGSGTKIPQIANPFSSPTTAKWFSGGTTDNNSGASTTPTVQCGPSFGYVAYAANMPCAWQFMVVPNQEIIADILFPLQSTTDGVQPGNGRISTQADGQTISSGVLPPGKFPSTISVRMLMRWSHDFFFPDNATLQMGGKGMPGFGHLAACGNGGAYCGSATADGLPSGGQGAMTLSDSGRIGWFARGEQESPQNPRDPFYRKQIFGDYLYWANASQDPYFWGERAFAQRDKWVCIERRITMNTIVTTSPTAAVGARPMVLGTGYVNGETVTVVGGTHSVAATYTVTTDGSGHVASLAQAGGGTYTVFPFLTAGTGLSTTSSGGGTGLTVELMPVDTSSSDGKLEAWIGTDRTNEVKVEDISSFKFRGTPPWVPAAATYGGARPNMFGDGAVRDVILNYFLGGVYGGWPGAIGHWFIKSIAISDGTRIGCPKLS